MSPAHGLVGYRQTPEHIAKRAAAVRFWTPQRIWRLMTLLERGWDDARIGADLGVTAGAVNVARKTYGVRSRRAMFQSAAAVGRCFGVTEQVVVRWIQARRLPGFRERPGTRYHRWFVWPADVVAFVENPVHWERWDPRRVTDPQLRALVEQLRPEAFEPLLTVRQVADRLCLHCCSVREAIQAGRLPGVRLMHRWHVPEAALARYTPPPIGGAVWKGSTLAEHLRVRDERQAA